MLSNGAKRIINKIIIILEKRKSHRTLEYDRFVDRTGVRRSDWFWSVGLVFVGRTSTNNIYNTRSVKERKLVSPFVKNYYGKRTSKYLTPTRYNKIAWLRKDLGNISKLSVKNKLKLVLLTEFAASMLQ